MSGKDELQQQLEAAKKRFADIYAGEVVVYAAAPKPERKPWKKRATPQELAYRQALQKAQELPEK